MCFKIRQQDSLRVQEYLSHHSCISIPCGVSLWWWWLTEEWQTESVYVCARLLSLPPFGATLRRRHSTKSQFSAVSNCVWAGLYGCHGLSRQVPLKRRWEMLMISLIECACYSLAVAVTLFVLHEFQWPIQRAVELLNSLFDQDWINKAALTFVEH